MPHLAFLLQENMIALHNFSETSRPTRHYCEKALPWHFRSEKDFIQSKTHFQNPFHDLHLHCVRVFMMGRALHCHAFIPKPDVF